MSKDGSWVGYDLDGTLAYYDGWKGSEHIGEPVPKILQMLKDDLAAGEEVRIFTARVAEDDELTVQEKVNIIQDWTELHIGERLPVTCIKDPGMKRLYDDKAIRVVVNAAQRLLNQ